MATTKANATYEAMFLFPGAAASDMDGALGAARLTIERHGGTIIVLKKWDERKLTYEIERNKRGVYIIAYFTAPGTVVTGIERDVSLSDNMLRVMITHADHLNETEMNAVEPQPIIKEERPSWDRGFGSGFEGGGGGGGGRSGGYGDRPPRTDKPRRDDVPAMDAKD